MVSISVGDPAPISPALALASIIFLLALRSQLQLSNTGFYIKSEQGKCINCYLPEDVVLKPHQKGRPSYKQDMI